MTFSGEEKPELNTLAHFGVKGMKWGVHRDRMAATTLTKNERKEAKQNVKKLSAKAFDSKYGDDFLQRKITQEQYNSLSTKGLTIKKGQEIGRVSNRKDEKFQGMTYASFKPHDRVLYRAVMPIVSSPLKMGGNKRYKNTYESTFKSLETLKSPSAKERVDAFSEMFDTPSIKLKNGKTVTGREFLKRDFPQEVKTLTAHQLGLRFYNNFTESQYSKSPINSAYFERVKAKGFNALVDDNDSKHLSDTPLIILNPNGSLKKMNVKKLTADDINNAQRSLKVE